MSNLKESAQKKYGCRWSELHETTREDFEAGWLAAKSDDKARVAAHIPFAGYDPNYPPLPKPTSWQIAIVQDNEHGQSIVGWRVEFSEVSFNFSYLPKRTMFTAEQMRAYVDADRAARGGAA